MYDVMAVVTGVSYIRISALAASITHLYTLNKLLFKTNQGALAETI